MKVIITEKAKEYIEEHKMEAVRAEVVACSSWAGVVYRPSVLVGIPSDDHNYTEYNVDGVKVYVKKGVEAKDDTLKIDHAKFLWNEGLVLDGALA